MCKLTFRTRAIGLLAGSILKGHSTCDRKAHRVRSATILQKCLFILFAFFSLISVAQAKTITAVSCAAEDVQNAMSVAVAGDTVSIPEGSCSWTTQVSWTAPDNVTLMGTRGDQTIIIDNYNSVNPILKLNVSSTGRFRMTGITIKGGTGTVKYNGMVSLSGSGGAKANVRIDHVHFDGTTYSSKWTGELLLIGAGVIGVMDNSILDLYSTQAVYVLNDTDGLGNATWASDTGFGGSDFFYIEDCIINGTASTHDTRATDCYTGGKVVVRFCDLTACAGGTQHGTRNLESRGCRASEFYGNSAVLGSGQTEPNYSLFSPQSGPVMIWGNTAGSGVYKNVIVFRVVRKNNETYTMVPPPNGFGYCGEDFNGTGSAWDENSDSGTGYACIDQAGRGKGDLLTGIFPNKVNSTTGTIHWPNQALEPVYIWANSADPAPGWGGKWYLNKTDTASRYIVQADRDYYAQASGVQTSPTSPFDGTSGTGWGILANRPTTCTKGVGYWATDQGSWNTSSSNPYGVQQNGADGVLYKCTAPNTWTLYYVPYTYPHPLTQGETSLTPPSNFHMVQ